MFWLLFRSLSLFLILSLTQGVYVCGETLLCDFVCTVWYDSG